MTNDIGKIAEARAIAAKAYRTIKGNLFFGVGVLHVLGITAALLKIIGPIEAAVIHLGPRHPRLPELREAVAGTRSRRGTTLNSRGTLPAPAMV